MTWGIFHRWRRTKSFTPSEMAVISALLSPAGVAYSRLRQQAMSAPSVDRKLEGPAAFQAIVPYVTDARLLIESDRDIQSPALEVVASSGTRLSFSIEVRRGGFLTRLLGKTTDGTAWDREWQLPRDWRSTHDVRDWLTGSLRSPFDPCTGVGSALLRWAGIEADRVLSHGHKVFLARPASAAQIEDAVSRLQVNLSADYRGFVEICNGITISNGHQYAIFGTDDLAFLDDERRWLVVTDLYEDGVVALVCEGGRMTDQCCRVWGTEVEDIGSLRRHVSDSIGWET